MSKRALDKTELSISEGEQHQMLAPNITRRKNRHKLSNNGESEDDMMDVPSTAKKNHRNMADYHPGKAKRNINGALQAVENKGTKAPVPDGPVDVVSVLLKAHMESKRVINSANCFEKQTVLDFISKNSIMQESIQDMAFVLDSAVSVYTIRVDRTHGLTMAVKSNVNSGMKDGDKGKAATDESAPSDTKEAKKQAAKSMMVDWKTKFDNDRGERELTPQEEEEEEDDEEDEEKGEGLEEAEEDSWLAKVPENTDYFEEFLDGIIGSRKQNNSKLNTFNSALTDDRDVLLDRSLKQMSSNEYYQKAVSRYGEGTSDSLLMNNAKFTSDGKAYVIHARIPAKASSKIPESVPICFSRGLELTLSNALSEKPQRTPNDLLPTADELMTFGGGSNSDNEDELGTIRDLETLPTDSTSGDVTVLPDVTIADVTMMPNRTMLPMARNRRKTAVFRGKEINQLWIPDDFMMDLAESMYPGEELELTRISNLRHQRMLPLEGRGRLPTELTLTEEEFRERMRPMEMSGIADELRDLDNIWNAQVVRRVVTEAETEEMFRHAERIGGSEEDIRVLKKRILPPGSYIFFMEPDGPNPLVPVDQWADEGTELADVSGFDDVFYDANDDDMFGGGGFSPGGSNLNMANETRPHYSDDEKTAQAVRTVMEHNPMNLAQQPLLLDAPNDDIPDVPVNPGAVVESPDDALRNLGKADDAHWKGNKVEPEKKERPKKEKKPAEEKVVNVDSYFTISTAQERKDALKRYKSVKTGLEKDDKSIFMKRKPVERRLYQQYDFQLFLKPGLLNHGRYNGMRFQRVATPDDRFNRVAELLGTEEDGAEVDDVVGREWMQLFSGLILRDNAEDEEDSFHSVNGSLDELIDNAEDLEEDDDFGGAPADFDDDGTDVERDSFHSAVQIQPDLSSPVAVVPPPRAKKDNIIQELHRVQGEESDEEEGEVLFMIEQKVRIKNTNIDQSKVKSYLKGILTNPKMDVESLRAVSRSADDPSFLSTTGVCEKDSTVLAADNSLLNDSNIDPLEVSRIVFAPVDEQSQVSGSQLKHTANSSQDALTNAVVLSDFDVQGTHTLTSLMACLPFRAHRAHEKSMHVSFAFSIALQMCNENTLQCVQDKDGASSGRNEDWMGDFIIRNGSSTAGFGNEALPNGHS